MEQIPTWMAQHEQSDIQHFNTIEASLDDLKAELKNIREEMNTHMDEIKPYLEAATAFKLGGKGVAYIGGFLIGLGTLIYLGLQILGKR